MYTILSKLQKQISLVRLQDTGWINKTKQKLYTKIIENWKFKNITYNNIKKYKIQW